MSHELQHIRALALRSSLQKIVVVFVIHRLYSRAKTLQVCFNIWTTRLCTASSIAILPAISFSMLELAKFIPAASSECLSM